MSITNNNENISWLQLYPRVFKAVGSRCSTCGLFPSNLHPSPFYTHFQNWLPSLFQQHVFTVRSAGESHVISLLCYCVAEQQLRVVGSQRAQPLRPGVTHSSSASAPLPKYSLTKRFPWVGGPDCPLTLMR